MTGLALPSWADEAGLVALLVSFIGYLGGHLWWMVREADRLYGPGGFDYRNMAHRRIQREYRQGKWRDASPYVPGIGVVTPEVEEARRARERAQWMTRQRVLLWEWDERFERWQAEHPQRSRWWWRGGS